MPNYSQAGRSLQITTPLGADRLLLVGFRGQEAISRLFRFELDMLADADTDIQFNNIVGQNVTVAMTLPNEETRYFSGIVKRFSQGASDEIFTVYHAVVVPKVWLLTKTVQSCIFQSMSVPDILSQVLSGYNVTYQLSGTYYPRNYCVQYRETDFDFASRLMEDEGIYYYFSYSNGAHEMIVTDAQTTYPEVAAPSSIDYEPRHEGVGEVMRIRTWVKAQELCANQYTVGEYCFEIPTSTLEQSAPTIDQVQVGTVTHKFNLAGQELEIYDYPAGCAKRYDGVDSSGGAFAAGFTQMAADRTRIVGVRMEEQECTGLKITGTSDCGNLSAGYAFTLEGHFNGDDDYLLTRVEHRATLSGYRAEEQDAFNYDNRFVCMPTGLIYRPRRVTPKPVIAGFQTATVTGQAGDTSSGQSVFCDQYGRVKVQFHWDREGQMNGNSSCWLRVAQVWAGNGWGAFFWPRVGNEVVVAFEEGDPDQPMIVGSAYNAANMPPYALPANNQLGGIRSASVSGSSGQNFNGIIFNDVLGTEHLAIHSENNMSLNAEKDKQFHGGRNKGERVARTSLLTVGSLPTSGGSGGGPRTNSPSSGGTGGGPPTLSLSPSSLAFGNQQVGETSAAQTVTLTNTGNASVNITVALTGTNSGDYAQTNTCGSSVAGNGNCTISVTYTPSAQGSGSATLTVTDPTGNTCSVALTGTGSVIPFSQGNTMQFEAPQSYKGLYAETFYGNYVEMIVGQYAEPVLGSAATLVVDPAALFNLIPVPYPAFQAFLAGATGGNNTFVLGNNISFTLGRQFEFKICPAQQNTGAVTLSTTQNIVIGILCGLLGILVIIWAVLYAAFQSDVPYDDSPCEMVVGLCEGIAGIIEGAILIAGSVWDEAQKAAASGAHVQVAALPPPVDDDESLDEEEPQPDQPQPDQPQPDQPQPDQPQPDQPQPDQPQPDQPQPDQPQPDQPQPDQPQPDQPQPDQPQPDQPQPDQPQPDQPQPDQPQPDQPQPDQPQPDQPQPDQPQPDQPQPDQPQPDQPQPDQPQPDQPQPDQPQPDQPAPQNEGPPAPQDEEKD